MQKTSSDNTGRFCLPKISEHDRLYLMRALSLAIGIRLALFIISYVIGREVLERSASLYELMHEALCRWDTMHYINIAQHGYSYTKETEHLLGFFLLFPFLIKIGTFVFRDFFISGLIISFAASVTAGYFLQKLVSLDGDENNESDKALWYFYLFPTSYFLVVPYSESLFLALSIASFYFARKRHWLTSGLLAALASATRINGIVLLPALIAEAFLQERRVAIKKAFWLLLSPLGLLLNLLNCWYVTGNAMAYVEIQKSHFSQNTILPWNNIISLFEQYFNSFFSSYKTMSIESPIVGVLITILLLLIAWRWLRISYQIYAWAQIALLLSASWIISYPRLVLVIFPIFIILAKVARNEQIYKLLSVATAICMGGLFAIFAMGRWTF